MGYILAQAAVTKYYRMDGLNNRNFFLIALEAEIRVPVWSGSGEGSLPGLKMVAFWLCPHTEEGEALVSISLLLKALIPKIKNKNKNKINK